MPFVRVRALDAVQYQDVCMGITGAIGTSYSVIGGTMIIPTSVRELILQRLDYTYIDPGVVVPPEPIRSQPGFITHIKPERFTGTGPWSQAHGS
jgi:hypothetical protein